MQVDPDKLRILHDLDVESSLAVTPYTPPGGFNDRGEYHDTRTVAIAGLHKARVYLGRKHFSKSEIALSRQWLSDHGYAQGPHR